MKIDHIRILPYELNLKKKYSNSRFTIHIRRGWILELGSDGIMGYGDASPLDGFSFESYDQSGYGLEGFKLSLKDIDDFDIKELLELANAHGELQPSVQFAIESAVYDLTSKINQLPLDKYLNNNSSGSVKVNYYENYC